MLKEVKYLIFLLIITLFIFFTAKYYFSDSYKKKSYRSLASINEKIEDLFTRVTNFRRRHSKHN
jgi:hypothetical protein